MNSLSGYVKVFRKLKAWGWYQDYVVKDVFIHLLLSANFVTTTWNGRTLKKGQLVTSTVQLAAELGFSRQQVRTAINKLKSTSEITTESTNKYTVITIVNWRDYQSDTNFSTNTLTNTATNEQPTINQQSTNNQPQYKNRENIKNKKNREKREGTLSQFGQFKNVLLTDLEMESLRSLYPDVYEKKIERLSRYIESKGKDYDNHYAVLCDWIERDYEKDKPKPKSKTSYDMSEVKKIDTLDFVE